MRPPLSGSGITIEGVKIPLGLWEGSSENATVTTALLSAFVERGLDPEQGILFVIDGSLGGLLGIEGRVALGLVCLGGSF